MGQTLKSLRYSFVDSMIFYLFVLTAIDYGWTGAEVNSFSLKIPKPARIFPSAFRLANH